MADEPLVLVIDDETGSRESMAIALEKAGLKVRTFDDAKRALEYLDTDPGAGLVVSDLKMPGMGGIEFLRAVRERGSDLAVILVTGFGSLETAVEAMRVGADDYLTKPVDLYELRKRVKTLLENRQLKEEVTSLKQMLDKRYGFESIIGKSAPMERLFEQMRLVAPTRSTVLVVGESGTGKELVAHALHRASPRREQSHSGDQLRRHPDDLLESELFGHEKGAFTGADRRARSGKFELADGGTLFLDEIGELIPSSRSSCCGCCRSARSCGSAAATLIDVDVRLIAATNRDLEEVVADGKVPRGPLLPAQGRHSSHPAAA